MFDLTGQVAVVTGASSGIGQATAVALARSGAHVASLYLDNPGGAEHTAKQVELLGRDVMMVQGDTSDSRQVDQFAHQVNARWGRIDIWVNNAARVIVRPFVEITDDEWHALLATNLDGYFHGCRAAARYMIPRGYGRIVNVSSNTYYQPVPQMAAYVASKGGVIGLTRAIALELIPFGIAVNSVAPGTVDSAMNRDLFTPEVRKAFSSRIAAGRIGAGDDIAGAIVFLSSEEARYVTGQDLLVDGGLTLNGDVGIIAV